jgi:response regulator of citrate/malate metabolism
LDIEVIGVVFGKTDVLRCCLSTQVDVLLLDMHPILDNYEGIDVSIEIHRMKKQIKTIILSSAGDEEIIFHAMTYGRAVNYITKEFYLVAHIFCILRHSMDLGHPLNKSLYPSFAKKAGHRGSTC